MNSAAVLFADQPAMDREAARDFGGIYWDGGSYIEIVQRTKVRENVQKLVNRGR